MASKPMPVTCGRTMVPVDLAADSVAVEDSLDQADWLDQVVPADQVAPADLAVLTWQAAVVAVAVDLAAGGVAADLAVLVDAAVDAAGKGLRAIATATRPSSAIARRAITIALPDRYFTPSATQL